MNMKLLTTHVPAPLADKVDEIATRLEQSSDWVVKQALTAWVAQQEDRYQATLDALDDVDNGLIVEHSFIENWANGLNAEQR